MSFFAELKRRNVIRVAGLYLVGAWLMVQVLDTLLPMFGAPEWVAKSVVIVMAVGFVPALILAWVFELTPQGLKRDDGAEKSAGLQPQTAQRINRLIVVALLGVIAMMAVDRFWQRAPDSATAGNSSASTSDPSADSLGIGVLPFGNLSPDPDNAFFAGGIYEEVLTRVSRINELRVISRTSMETIAAEKLAIPEIGVRLGVTHVMEGSVRRSGDQVRITVQLIEAATDKHIWAENYDRTLDDVFAIQSEIALAIADQLKIVLSSGQQSALAEQPTDSTEAYDLYLRAVEQRRVWRGAAGFEAVIALLEPAIALDPEFIEAQVYLADAHGRMAWLNQDADGEHEKLALELVADMQRRWPERFETRWAQADLTYNVSKDYAEALALYQPLLIERPNNVDIAINVSSSLKRLNRNEDFLNAITVAEKIDPESPKVAFEKVIALGGVGRRNEALALSDLIVRRMPDDPAIAVLAANSRLFIGGDRSKVLAIGDIGAMNSSLPEALFSEGDVDGAARWYEARARSAEGLAAATSRASQAEMFRLAKRDAEGLPIAKRALADALAWAADRELESSDMAGISSIAAIADESAAAREWMARAQASKPDADNPAAIQVELQLGAAMRWLGDVDAAWRPMAALIEAGDGPPDGVLLGLRPYFDAQFGESAEYRAYVAELEARW